MKRRPIKRKSPLKAKTALKSKTVLNAGDSSLKRSKINPVSDIQHAKNKAWETVRKVALQRDGNSCQARFKGCNKRATDVHHILPRGRGGTNELSNLISLCAWCHTLSPKSVHNDPEHAKKLGLLKEGYQ